MDIDIELSRELEAALRATAEQEGLTPHDAAVCAIDAYTSRARP